MLCALLPLRPAPAAGHEPGDLTTLLRLVQTARRAGRPVHIGPLAPSLELAARSTVTGPAVCFGKGEFALAPVAPSRRRQRDRSLRRPVATPPFDRPRDRAPHRRLIVGRRPQA